MGDCLHMSSFSLRLYLSLRPPTSFVFLHAAPLAPPHYFHFSLLPLYLSQSHAHFPPHLSLLSFLLDVPRFSTISPCIFIFLINKALKICNICAKKNLNHNDNKEKAIISRPHDLAVFMAIEHKINFPSFPSTSPVSTASQTANWFRWKMCGVREEWPRESCAKRLIRWFSLESWAGFYFYLLCNF